MHPDHDFADLVVGILSIVAFVGAVLFFASYVIFFRVTRTRAGRAIAILIGGQIAVSVTSLLFVWLGPEYFGRDVVRGIAWAGVAAGMWGLFVSLWMAWFRHRSVEMGAVEPRTGPVGLPGQPTPPSPEPSPRS